MGYIYQGIDCTKLTCVPSELDLISYLILCHHLLKQNHSWEKTAKKELQIGNYNNKKKLKKCWSSIQSSSSIAHKQIITCNNNAFVPVCQFLEEHRLETSNLQKQWFSHHMDFLSLSTLIDCQKRQAKTNHCCWNRNYNMKLTHTIWTIRDANANWKLGGKCYGPTPKRKISGAKFNVTPSFSWDLF